MTPSLTNIYGTPGPLEYETWRSSHQWEMPVCPPRKGWWFPPGQERAGEPLRTNTTASHSNFGTQGCGPKKKPGSHDMAEA